MRFVPGTITITTSGTELPLSTHSGINAAEKVLALIVRNTPTNTGNIFIGISGMSVTDGWTVQTGETSPSINFREIGGSVRADQIFFDVTTSAEEVDFMAILGE